MWRAIALVCLLAQATPAPPRSSIVSKASEPPLRNVQVLFYDEAFLFAGRTFGDRRTADASLEPALFVHSKDKNRWLQILAILDGGREARQVVVRRSADAEEAARRADSRGTSRRSRRGRTSISRCARADTIAFPDHIVYDAASDRYELPGTFRRGAPRRAAETCSISFGLTSPMPSESGDTILRSFSARESGKKRSPTTPRAYSSVLRCAPSARPGLFHDSEANSECRRAACQTC